MSLKNNIIVGSKDYLINLNEIIDYFEFNCRINLSMPKW